MEHQRRVSAFAYRVVSPERSVPDDTPFPTYTSPEPRSMDVGMVVGVGLGGGVVMAWQQDASCHPRRRTAVDV
ncbi:hypothetical protein E2C01_010938 [Portunus trituberculatus]|uniref:Uncharacterized protein n=1 Tax=Portunus trituberculatus TaxID=210409 RepID=A0A5B7D9P6_PORTR|nr:hypothetical protein [Portunus trituberculatus]